MVTCDRDDIGLMNIDEVVVFQSVADLCLAQAFVNRDSGFKYLHRVLTLERMIVGEPNLTKAPLTNPADQLIFVELHSGRKHDRDELCHKWRSPHQAEFTASAIFVSQYLSVFPTRSSA